MYSKQYEKLSKPFRKYKSILLFMNKLLTFIGYTSYPILLGWTWFINKELLLPMILIPGIGFILLTFVRKVINRKRPYETYNIDSMIKKDTKGNSMPSRHVFSMSIIAVSWFVVSPIVGSVLLLFSILLAFIRVIGGVHYISDVIVAIICACVWGLLFIFFPF